jgi:hypothetical protein
VSELVPESQIWQLVATELPRKAIDSLKGAGLSPETHGDVVTIQSKSLDEIYRALGLVKDLGGQLVEITRPQSSLEEQFLKAVKAVSEDTQRERVGTKSAKK